MFLILKNELYKIFHNKRIYMFLIILLLFIVAIAYLINSIEPSLQMSATMLDKLKGAYFPIQILSTISDLLLPMFVTLIITLLFSDEYYNGTLKIPLLNGFTRIELITAKLLISIITTIIMLICVFALSYLTSFLFWGDAVSNNKVFVKTVQVYSLTLLPFIALITIVLFLSMFIKNSGIIIGVIVSVLVLSSFISSLFPGASQYILTYYLKAFSAKLDGINLSKSISICIAYGIVFLAGVYARFSRMEIDK